MSHCHCKIEESFIAFIHTHQNTGQYLSAELLLKKPLVSQSDDSKFFENLRRQVFNDGSNMTEKYRAGVSQINELAKYVFFRLQFEI